jgi:hypothetical protein
VDSNGVFWVALSRGHLGSFDRRKCKATNGPTATGKHCPEGAGAIGKSGSEPD